MDTLKQNRIEDLPIYSNIFGESLYLWWSHIGKIRYHDGRIQLQGVKSWNNGSNIKMIVDCNKWTLQFELEADKFQAINIEPNVEYYVALGTASGDNFYLYNLKHQ